MKKKWGWYNGNTTSPQSERFIAVSCIFGTIQKLFFVVGNIKAISGFNQISEEKFLAYVELIKPAGKEVAEKLYGDFSEDANLAIHEDRVFDFVKKYLTSLSKDQTELFLKYMTDYEIMARDLKIGILFNPFMTDADII